MKRLQAWLVALCWVLGSVAQDGLWHGRQITSLDGLPQNSVLSMAMDAEGYLLLSTESGLVRFDGFRFRPIPLDQDDGSTGGRTREIFILGDGTLGLRDAGNHVYSIGRNKTLRHTPGRKLDYPYPMLLGGFPTMEDLVIASEGGGGLPAMNEWSADQIGVVALDAERWATMGKGRLLIYKGRTLDRSVSTPVEACRYLKLQGHHYVFDQRANAERLWPDEGTRAPVVMHNAPPQVERACDRLFWRQGEGQACFWSGSSVWTITPSSGGDTLHWAEIPMRLTDKCVVNDVLYDQRSKVLFIGTDTRGLFIYRPKELQTVQLKSGSGACYAQAPYADRQVLVNTRSGAVLVDLESDEQRPIDAIRNLHNTGFVLDRAGHIVFSWGNDLCIHTPGTKEFRKVTTGRRFDARSFLAEGDTIWVGSRQGLGTLVGDHYEALQTLEDKNWTTIPTSICRDANGDLLLASCDGLSRVRGSGPAEPLHLFPGHCPRVLHRHGDHVFIGTYGTGAYVMDRAGTFRKLPMDRQGYLTHVHAFAEDANGTWWITSNQGLFRVEKADIQAWLHDPEHQIYYSRYGSEMGIANSEFNGGCYPPYLELAGGMLSFPTMGGLVFLRPGSMVDPFPLAPIALEDVQVDGRPIGPGGAFELPEDHDELVISLSMPYWGSAGNAQLEYGLDGTWHPLSTGSRELRLQRLRPGEHILEVRKVGGLVRGDHGGVRLTIIVARPMYLRWWFILGLAVCLVVLVWWAIHVSAAILRRRNQLLEERVQERTRALQQANVKLKQAVEVRQTLVSVISHDIVSPLRFIARVSANAKGTSDPEDLRDKVADISHSSDRLFNHAQNLLNWVKHQQGAIEVRPMHVPVRNMVDDVFELVGQKAREYAVELGNEVQYEDVVRTDPDILLVVLQNLVSNAVSNTRNGRLTVHASGDESTYRITVKDTGIGIPAHVMVRIRAAQEGGMYSYWQADRGHGLGLVIVFGLLDLVRARLEVESTTGEGTTITVVLPLDPRTSDR